MAFKPPPISDVLQQINDMVGNQNLKGEADKAMKALTQSALQKLEVVSREEFDAQAAILKKTQQRVKKLEAEIATLSQELDALESK